MAQVVAETLASTTIVGLASGRVGGSRGRDVVTIGEVELEGPARGIESVDLVHSSG